MPSLSRKIKSFVLGSLIFVGLPLVAWGINHVSDYFQNDARLCYSVMMIVSALLVVLFVPDEGRGSGKGEKVVQRQRIAILFLQITSIVVVVVAPFHDRRGIAVIGDAMIIRYIGLITTFWGYLLMNLAILELGRQFSLEVTIQKDHKLITSGIYRFIRHPRYLGIVLFMTGISLVFHSWIAVVFSVLTLIVLIWRISDEEKMMRQEFQNEWEEYSKNSWRLIPYLF